jgi:hypothetical protein
MRTEKPPQTNLLVVKQLKFVCGTSKLVDIRADHVELYPRERLRQDDSRVFKRYSHMKLQMKREAWEKLNRQADEMALETGTATIQ